MAPPADRLSVIAQRVIDAVAATIADPPVRQYRTIGLPAFDCEELVVAVDGTIGHDGDPSVEATRPADCLVMRAANLSVWLIRCVPALDDSAEAPAASVIDASGVRLMADVVDITNAIVAAYQAHTLSTATGLVMLQGQGVTASGGFGGWVQRVRIDLSHV